MQALRQTLLNAWLLTVQYETLQADLARNSNDEYVVDFKVFGQ
jgi:hypothetical protein